MVRGDEDVLAITGPLFDRIRHGRAIREAPGILTGIAGHEPINRSQED
jgi:hypothetical protein